MVKTVVTRVCVIVGCQIIVDNKLYKTTKMDDMIAPQIRDNCKLALPDGLKELMNDITREVSCSEMYKIYFVYEKCQGYITMSHATCQSVPFFLNKKVQ